MVSQKYLKHSPSLWFSWLTIIFLYPCLEILWKKQKQTVNCLTESVKLQSTLYTAATKWWVVEGKDVRLQTIWAHDATFCNIQRAMRHLTTRLLGVVMWIVHSAPLIWKMLSLCFNHLRIHISKLATWITQNNVSFHLMTKDDMTPLAAKK